MNVFLKRRAKLKKLLQSGILILSNVLSSTKTAYADIKTYDNNFFYLTGLTQPDSLLIVDLDADRTLFFGRDIDPLDEIWLGAQLTPSAIAEYCNFDQAYSLSQLAEKLSILLLAKRPLYWLPSNQLELDRLIAPFSVKEDPNTLTHQEQLIEALSTCRLIKDEEEEKHLRKAAQISGLAHHRAMQKLVPNLYEYQIEAELLYQFMQEGARQVAYDSVVASGKNACILHYVHNNALIRKGELLLIDAGCKWQGYASDITRTIPVNGRFSGPQRDVYEIVLAAQQAAIDLIKPHTHCQSIAKAALTVLVQGMIDLKLLKGSLEKNIAQQTYRQFYMHGIGHWLGLDVHDVGKPFSHPDNYLVPNMCLTVEPGLYIRPDANIPPALHNIGVRIEDDILVTSTGCEVYTAPYAPKAISDIEELMREAA